MDKDRRKLDINQVILNLIRDKGKITVNDVVRITGFSRVYIHRFFQVLADEGKIVRIGRANQIRYVLADENSVRAAKKDIQSFSRILGNKNLHEDQIFELIHRETGIFQNLPGNVTRILEYAFTEMLNNAIEHSRSLKIKISMKRDSAGVRFDVVDWGIGIFENLIHSRHLASVEEAIQDLLKGKQTTAPEAHTGEGIFFTRRVADTFIIRSAAKKLFFDNIRNDFTIQPIKHAHGTRITFTIAGNSARELWPVFKKYSAESFEFGVTEVKVRLYQPGGARDFISRSQARRILTGLEKFKSIILDFEGVDAVGQGFADEIFRVWHAKFPAITITPQNMNEEVSFMMRRSIATPGKYKF